MRIDVGGVAVEQLPKTQAQETARLLIPNGDGTIGTGLERILVNNEPAEKVFADVAKNGRWIAVAHVSFPGIGHIRQDGAGYVYYPVNYTIP